MPDTQKTRFELAVELAKALVWPILVAVLFIVFWTPLHEVASLAPTLIRQSESITIANVSIKLGKRLSGQASANVKEKLAAMTPHSIEVLLSHSGSAYWDNDASFGRSENAQLVKLGLLREIPADELRKRNPDKHYSYAVELTDSGREVRQFLFALISEFASELQDSKPAAEKEEPQRSSD